MSFKAEMEKYTKSDIYNLVYETKIYGLRVKSYNIEKRDYDYFDFSLEFIQNDKEVLKWLNDHAESFSSINLVYNESANTLLTKDEIDGKITVQEFKDEANAIGVLKPIIKIYEEGGHV